jgi:hypothetical protein
MEKDEGEGGKINEAARTDFWQRQPRCPRRVAV